MYKLSKFNYFCGNNKGELLLFNSYKGFHSTCKVRDKELQKDILKLTELNEFVREKMLEKGIIVSTEEDEGLKLNHLICTAIAGNGLRLTISPTEQCNFRCKYCYETHLNLVMSDKEKADLINYVKRNIHKHNSLHVSWFGGEPLLALDLIKELSGEFIKYCKMYRRQYSSIMTTNGYLLNLETAKMLVDYGVRLFQITIDGVKEVHDNQRPLIGNQPTFDTIFNNLQKIKESNIKNIRIVIRSNVTNDIFKYLDEYLDMLIALCENDDRFSVSINHVAKWSDNIDKDFEESFFEGLRGLSPIYQRILELKLKLKIVSPLNPIDSTCHLGKNNSFFIRPNGEVHKCTILYEDPNNIIGNLVNGDIVLNHKYYSRLSNPNTCPKLTDCFYAPLCKGEVCPSTRGDKKKCPDSIFNLKYYLQLLDNYSEFELIDEYLEG